MPGPAPSQDDRDSKDALRSLATRATGVAAVRTVVAPEGTAAPIAPTPRNFGSHEPVYVPSCYSGAAAYAASHRDAAVAAAATEAEAAAARPASAATPNLPALGSTLPARTPTASLPRHPALDEKEATIAPHVRATVAAALSQGPAIRGRGKRTAAAAPTGSAPFGGRVRPVPQPRSRLPPAPPSIFSLPGAAAGAATPPRSTGESTAPPVSAKAKATAAKVAKAKMAANKAAKVAAGKAAAAAVAPSKSALVDTTGTEALAGLLALTGKFDNVDAVIAGNKELATRGVSLGALSKAVGQLEVGQKCDASPTSQNADTAIDCDLVPNPSLEGPPSKRSKAIDLDQLLLDPLYQHGGDVKRSKPHGGDVKPSKPQDVDEAPATTNCTPSLRSPPLSAAQKLSIETAAQVAKNRAEGMTVMVGARKLLKKRVKAIIGNAETTGHVFPPPSMRTQLFVDSIKDHAKVVNSRAIEFLAETVLSPVKGTTMEKKRKRTGEDSPKRAARIVKAPTTSVLAKFNQAFSHVYGEYKRNVVVGWFKEATGHPKEVMMPPQAATYLETDSFSRSTGGRKGVIAGVAKGYHYLGVKNRVRYPGGDDKGAVTMCSAHYALAATLIREELESIRDGRSESTAGPDANRYTKFVNEMESLHDFLPKHSCEEDGLILCDGADPKRANFDDESAGKAPDASAEEAATVKGAREMVAGAVPIAGAEPVAAVVLASPPLPPVAVAEVRRSVAAGSARSAGVRARVAALKAAHEAELAALLAEQEDDGDELL